jgi:antitoxin (DNA-binding transcriptional repressor) of toxin-antitoxin stability system
MREVSVREANQNFSKLVAAVEAGETILITKNGKTVAKMSPQPHDLRDDPEWQAAHRDLVESLRAKPATGFRVGKITEADKYDADKWSE